jgi:hypothetical protein
MARLRLDQFVFQALVIAFPMIMRYKICRQRRRSMIGSRQWYFHMLRQCGLDISLGQAGIRGNPPRPTVWAWFPLLSQGGI